MKRMLLILSLAVFSWKAFSQESISYPPCIAQLEQSQSFYQEIARKEIAKTWHIYYGYSDECSQAILDTLHIVCIPRFFIDIKRYPHQDFFMIDNLLASLIACDKLGTSKISLLSKYYWYHDRELNCDTQIYANKDSVVRMRNSITNELSIADRAILNTGFKAIFEIDEIPGWWLIMPDNTLVTYDLEDNIFCDPQEYLDRHRPKTAEGQAMFEFILEWKQDCFCNQVEEIPQEKKMDQKKIRRYYQRQQKRLSQGQ